MVDASGDAPAGGDADYVSFAERVVGVGDQEGFFGGVELLLRLATDCFTIEFIPHSIPI